MFSEMDRSVARSVIYSMLSFCFVYPDERVYGSIAAGEWIREFREALRLLDEKTVDDSLRAIEGTVSGAKEDEQLAMAGEYTRLFIKPFPHGIAPPYGSFYLEKERSSEKTGSEVLRFYDEAGFTLKEDLHDLPDHIIHELEFMGILADQESEATGGERIRLEEVQLHFLSRHIIPWVPIFCKKVVEQSLHPFYRILASLTEDFIGFEQNYLGMPEEKEEEN
jgi:putative dimethyl sulfoxide reductase chaperone